MATTRGGRLVLAGAAAVTFVAAHQLNSAIGAPVDLAPQPVVFAPHRAIYDLSIDAATPGSGVSSVNGRIVYELTGTACEGYTQNMRFVTTTSNSEGGSQTTDLRTSSWEQVPAVKLRFSSSTYSDDDLAEQSRGSAQRAAPQDSPAIDLVKPAKKSFVTASPVYFPMQHSTALIQAARAGKTHFAADLFDGSEDGSRIYTTSALIGAKLGPGAASIRSLAGQSSESALSNAASWPVSISYFGQQKAGEPAKHKDELPLYEMSYRFYENGVISNLRLDYGEYAMKGELKELVFLDVSPCPTKDR